MIVFTNTRTEESGSLSLFSNQNLLSASLQAFPRWRSEIFQNYYNSKFSNQFYKTGPDGVMVSIGACGALDVGSNPALGPIPTRGNK